MLHNLNINDFLIVKYSSEMTSNVFCECEAIQNEKKIGKKQELLISYLHT